MSKLSVALREGHAVALHGAIGGVAQFQHDQRGVSRKTTGAAWMATRACADVLSFNYREATKPVSAKATIRSSPVLPRRRWR